MSAPASNYGKQCIISDLYLILIARLESEYSLSNRTTESFEQPIDSSSLLIWLSTCSYISCRRERGPKSGKDWSNKFKVCSGTIKQIQALPRPAREKLSLTQQRYKLLNHCPHYIPAYFMSNRNRIYARSLCSHISITIVGYFLTSIHFPV